jgi:peroxiredoxin
MKTIFISIFLLAILYPLNGQNFDKWGVDTSVNIPSGLPLHQQAPNFQGIDQNGEKLELYSITKSQPVVLIFYRGNWCPVCNRYLKRYQDSLQFIEQEGAKVIAITPEAPVEAKETNSQLNAGFSIISDQNDQIMQQYKVTFKVTEQYLDRVSHLVNNMAKNNQQENAYLPVPATYIINQENEIIYRQFDINYRKRATVKEMINNLP